MANREYLFSYIALDEQLLIEPKTVYVDLRTVKVIGVQTKPVYNKRRNGFNEMTGFFIFFEGHQYGSIDVDPGAFTTQLLAGCGGFIHTSQFVDIFD